MEINLPKKRYLDFVYVHYNDKVFNRQLVKMWRQKFNFLPGYLLDPINRVNRLIPGWKTHAINFDGRTVKGIFKDGKLFKQQ